MREDDYILATSIARVMAITDLLRSLIATEQIPEIELSETERVVAGWLDACHAESDRRTEAEDPQN